MKQKSKSSLAKLPNVGAVLEGHLLSLGIKTPEQLVQTGSKETFRLIRCFRDPSACLHMLYGIEGAIQGNKDQYLSDEKKQELKKFYQSQAQAQAQALEPNQKTKIMD